MTLWEWSIQKKVKVDDASADGDLEDNDQIGQTRNTNFPTYSSYSVLPHFFSIYIRPSNLARSSLQQDKRISSLGPSLNYKQMSVIDSSPRLS